jgi:cytochrome c553
MVLSQKNEENNTPPLPRKKVFIIGTSATLLLCVLAWVYVPRAEKNETETISFEKNNAASTLENSLESSKNEPVSAPIAFIPPEESYTKYCSQCHGANGQGDTPMARMAGVKPTNLATGPYKYSRTVEGVSQLIQKGNGNSMPGFGKELGVENSLKLAEFVLKLEAKEK